MAKRVNKTEYRKLCAAFRELEGAIDAWAWAVEKTEKYFTNRMNAIEKALDRLEPREINPWNVGEKVYYQPPVAADDISKCVARAEGKLNG